MHKATNLQRMHTVRSLTNITRLVSCNTNSGVDAMQKRYFHHRLYESICRPKNYRLFAECSVRLRAIFSRRSTALHRATKTFRSAPPTNHFRFLFTSGLRRKRGDTRTKPLIARHSRHSAVPQVGTRTMEIDRSSELWG